MSSVNVVISRDNLNKIYAYADQCPQEISGFGRVVISGNSLRVTEVFIIDQEVTPAHTELTPDALYNAIQKEAALGKDTSDWMLWWHSHANFDAFLSSDDLSTIESLASSSPLVSMVVNKNHNTYLRVDIYQPLRLVVTDVVLEIVDEPNQQMISEVKDEIAAKVALSKNSEFFTDLSYMNEGKKEQLTASKFVARDAKGRFIKSDEISSEEFLYGKKTRRK